MWMHVAAWALLAAPEPLAPAPDLRLAALTGIVEIRDAVEIRGVARGVELPVALRPGSVVTVRSGTAAFVSRDLSVKTRAGDSFRYSLVYRRGRPVGVRLAGEGPRTDLLVEIGGSFLTVNEGDAVSVASSLKGGLEVQSRSGFVTLSVPGADRVLSPGEVAGLFAPPVPAEPQPRPASPAVADTLGIVEPGEELRSAPGPKPQPRK